MWIKWPESYPPEEAMCPCGAMLRRGAWHHGACAGYPELCNHFYCDNTGELVLVDRVAHYCLQLHVCTVLFAAGIPGVIVFQYIYVVLKIKHYIRIEWRNIGEERKCSFGPLRRAKVIIEHNICGLLPQVKVHPVKVWHTVWITFKSHQWKWLRRLAVKGTKDLFTLIAHQHFLGFGDSQFFFTFLNFY